MVIADLLTLKNNIKLFTVKYYVYLRKKLKLRYAQFAWWKMQSWFFKADYQCKGNIPLH